MQWKEKWSIKFHFLLGESDDFATISKIRQHIHMLKENQLMQQEKIKAQQELLNLDRS